MARTDNTQIQYFKALLDGRLATADFLEQQDPSLAEVRPPKNMEVSIVGGVGCTLTGEIKEAK